MKALHYKNTICEYPLCQSLIASGVPEVSATLLAALRKRKCTMKHGVE
jgi:hypothetical protein